MTDRSPTISVHLHRELATAVAPTPRVCRVAAMFGLGVDQRRTLELIPPTDLALRPGQLIFITGASGGGKSTLLRLIATGLAGRDDVAVIDFDALALDTDAALIDALDAPLADAMRYLALAGLSDAFVMLRRPRELSDGQRYRFRLACAMRRVERAAQPWVVVLADEFCSTLDRQTASVIGRNLRRFVTRAAEGAGRRVCFIAATTHDDLLEPLCPDTLIVPEPGAGVAVHERPTR